MILLDTNICIYLLKGTYPGVKEKFLSHSPANIGIPAIVKAELLFGANKSSKRDITLTITKSFLAPFQILSFGDEETHIYGRLRAEAEAEGKPIGSNDLMIASIALKHGAVLVTHNVREFSRVKGLVVEDWTTQTWV